MKVRLARTAGFCMGVRRAMELALASAHAEQGDICTFGPLIHNPQVLELLAGKGIKILDDVPEPGSRRGGTVIIRAHGVPPDKKHQLKTAGFSQIVDGTCPRVVRVQAIIRRVARAGGSVVIVGDAAHPEVVGLLGHARGPGRGFVVSHPGEVENLPDLENVVVVSQTTQNAENFKKVVKTLKKRFQAVEVHDTICEDTYRRQEEVRRLASEVDGVVVVGGRQSGNTKRLAEMARCGGGPVFLVETEAELDPERLASLGSVGVTAGASTPNWMIKKVMRELAAIRSAKEKGFVFWLRRVFGFLVRSQVVVGLGAAGMTAAASLLQGLEISLVLVGVSFFYIYAMHMLNHFLDKEAGQYNEPERALFLTNHRVSLISAGVFSAGLAMGLCLTLGWLPFLLVTVMSILGLLYSVPVVPRGLGRLIGIQSLKDIPGSKTLSASLAWAFMVAILPAVAVGPPDPWNTPLAFFYTVVLVFVRCALFDILDVQGDLMVGKETLPIVLGESKTRSLLWGLTIALALVLLSALWLGVASGLAWGLLLPVAGLAAMQLIFARDLMMPGALSEGLVDLNFWLAGVVALLGAAW